MKGEEITALSLAAIAIGFIAASMEGDPLMVAAGCVVGIATGLVPGLHINSLIPFVGGMAPFIAGVAISHSFFDFIPAILVGAPGESSSLSVLPSHKMLLRGRALEAFRLTVAGGLLSGLIAIAMLPLLGVFRELRFAVPFVLALSLLVMVKTSGKRAETVLAMALSAWVGFMAFGTPNGLPAILSGFFGVGTILYSLLSGCKIPQQRAHAEIRVPFREAALGAISGCIAGLFPGLSSSVSATMVSPRMRHKSFLIVIGGTNTVYAFIAILAIHLIGRPRSGAAIEIAKSDSSLVFLAGVSLAALGLSALMAWHLSKVIVMNFNRLGYRKLSLAALGIVLLLNAMNGPGAFSLMLLASGIGLFTVFSGARRSACMASLIIPVLAYYL